MNTAIIHLISGTGITPHNYKWWASKEECDNWFLGKSIKQLDKYSYVRGENTSRNGYNCAAIHINIPYSELSTCDYVSYKNEIFEDRWFHAQVIEREFVNQDSCRLYIAIDYVASYWETITFGKSFIERTHVLDDWKSEGTETASKYLLPEPFSIECRHRPDLQLLDPFKEVNLKFFPDQCEYTLITTVSSDGQINDPKINYQSGSAISGYVYHGDEAFLTDLLKKYVTFSSQFVVRAESTLNHVSSVYFCPKEISGVESAKPEYEEIDHKFQDLIDYSTKDNRPFVRHAKVLDYFRIRVIGNTNDLLFSPAEYGSRLWGVIWKTGGPNGCYTFIPNDKEGNSNGLATSTMAWPKVSVSATINAYDYKVNDVLKNAVSHNAPVASVPEGKTAQDMRTLGDRLRRG